MVKLHSFESASPRATFTACNVTVHGVTVQTGASACFAHRNGGRGRDTMAATQSGIFALGTSSHEYLEFDLRAGGDGVELIRAVANLREPRSTMGGVNLVSAFRPSLWRAASPEDIPAA